MSGTVSLTVGGSFGGQTGVVTIPSSSLFGALSTSGSLNALLQSYLGGITNGSADGTVNFEINDVAGATTFGASAATVAGAPSFEAITDTDSAGGSTAGSGSYTATVAAGVTDLAVQVPGNIALTGVGTTTKAIFGTNSNVNYSVTDPDAGKLFLAGGANSVSLYSTTTSNAESIYSAGHDTINLNGQGTDYVSVYGNAAVQIEAANAYVTAEGNATTKLYWDNANAGGSLTFINNSTAAALVQIGVFFNPVTHEPETSSTHVTAFGGAGGGFFVGGSAGNNSLVGGTGAVTLVGAGQGDFLEANSSLAGLAGNGNDFFQGSGFETMVASSSTGANFFQAGLNYPGLGQPPATGVISTDGSGAQNFLMGNVPGGETIYGSTVASATNAYIINSNATAGGGLYSIYNFTSGASQIYLENGAGGAGASITGMGADQFNAGQYDIVLSDHTNIQLKGLNAYEMGSIHTQSVFNGVTMITV
jgi:hypothetical protein